LEYLTYHLQAAGLGAELDKVCCDLRFLAVRLWRSGPAAVEADLARSGSPTAGRLRHVVAPRWPVRTRISASAHERGQTK